MPVEIAIADDIRPGYRQRIAHQPADAIDVRPRRDRQIEIDSPMPISTMRSPIAPMRAASAARSACPTRATGGTAMALESAGIGAAECSAGKHRHSRRHPVARRGSRRAQAASPNRKANWSAQLSEPWPAPECPPVLLRRAGSAETLANTRSGASDVSMPASAATLADQSAWKAR